MDDHDVTRMMTYCYYSLSAVLGAITLVEQKGEMRPDERREKLGIALLKATESVVALGRAIGLESE